jgi:hypothetical protein
LAMQDLMLDRHSTTWATPPALFCLIGSDFDLQSSWSLPPDKLGLQTWATGAQLTPFFHWKF